MAPVFVSRTLTLSLLSLPVAVAGRGADELVRVLAFVAPGNSAPKQLDLCPAVPADASSIAGDFHVHPGHLSPTGVTQVAATAAFLRQQYISGKPGNRLPISLLDSPWSSVRVTSTHEAAHAESAHALGIALLGTPPPQVEVPSSPDDLLGSPPASCARANKLYYLQWSRDHGMPHTYGPQSDVVQSVAQMCGHMIVPADYPTSGDNPTPPFEGIVSYMTSRDEEGLPTPGAWAGVRDQARSLAFRGLHERLFNTTEQKVFWAGRMPGTIVEAASKESGSPPLQVFVASPENLYAAAEYFRFRFRVEGAPEGAVVPGLALLFEVRQSGDGHTRVSVRHYHPDAPMPGASPTRRAALADVSIPGCNGGSCTVGELKDVVRGRAREVGGLTYKRVCETEAKHLSDSATGDLLARPLAAPDAHSWLLAALAAPGLLLLAAVALVTLKNQLRHSDSAGSSTSHRNEGPYGSC
eukprot:TRINITY_DN33114_c0_g1_i1.p1 TRINITY_DN33114_c0_g1~~TRINITY_DN33114_c0_g1_i1.p1  ORF type:complete len:468 (+),score=67.85 TRINITY_DN33114_c0_g1_i1:69-1472(+)